MISYPVGDLLIQIKNAALVGKGEVTLPSTNLLFATAEALKRAGFLKEVSKKDRRMVVKISLIKKHARLMGLSLVSKPGLRVYMNVAEIEKRKDPSTLILSTPKGILSSKEALKKRVGGEVIAKVW